ncbi:MAG: peptidylprolyl isomerase [Bdellovibrionales bacterium]|nr:peptidylprolyl isomerase [Bdellovibrionales bacterium]
MRSNDLAKVNDVPIKVSAVKARLSEYQFDVGSSTRQESLELKKSVLNELIEEELMAQQAKQMKISVSEKEMESLIQDARKQNSEKTLEQTLAEEGIPFTYWIQRTKQRVLAEKIFQKITSDVSTPTEKEMQQYFQNNFSRYRQPETVYLLQVVVKEKSLAEELRKQLLYGADFGEIAGQYSTTPESQKQGKLGWIERGHLPASLEKTAFSLRTGQMSKILESAHGFHILKVVDKVEERQIDYEHAKDTIWEELMNQKRQSVFIHWIEQITAKAHIKRNDVLLEEI